MNTVQTHVYHITYAKELGICFLFFWGCNLQCRICLLKKEAYDCHLPENRLRIYDPDYRSKRPRTFLMLPELFDLLSGLKMKKTFLMGAEPVCDPALPDIMHYVTSEKNSTISLLTNGKELPPLSMLDEIVFSIKAITPALHRTYTGFDNADIVRNFKTVAGNEKITLYTETIFIPDCVDEMEIVKIAGFIASVDKGIPFRIDAYLPVEKLPWRAPSVSEIESLAEKVKHILPRTTCFYGDRGNTPLAYAVERVF
jgi:molybdenum cofactor biosynthesis enzyme MoaA